MSFPISDSVGGRYSTFSKRLFEASFAFCISAMRKCCVGIDKEKGLRKTFAQKRFFASHFYSFVFYRQFLHSSKKHCENCVFAVLFVLNMLEI